jgi:putative transposase
VPHDDLVAAIVAFKSDYGAQVAQGGGQDRRRHRGAAVVLRIPAEHWVHLKTTNPIESTFATVRLRIKVTKGPGSKAAGLAMADKLIEAAQDLWRSVNAPHLVALVRAGAKFEKGVMTERPTKRNQEVAG